MPQNRPPAGHGRIDLSNQPLPGGYVLPDDENVDEQTGRQADPPPVLAVNPEGLPDAPGMVLVRGGTPWPQESAMKEAFDAAGPWPAALIKRGGMNRPPALPEPPEEVEDPPPPLATDRLVRTIARAFTPPPERELDPEPPGWDEQLYHWWVDTARTDIRGSLGKIVAYGGRGAAYDLIATGHDLAALNGRKVSDEEAAELAVLYYLSSKVNRMLAAAIDGRRGSDDTLFDITYYSLMARRIRAVGGWPIGTEKP